MKKNMKRLATILMVVAMMAICSVSAFAAGTADAGVTAAFTGLKDDVAATLGVVAGIGVGIMATFLAWKYGRKLFNQVAK